MKRFNLKLNEQLTQFTKIPVHLHHLLSKNCVDNPVTEIEYKIIETFFNLYSMPNGNKIKTYTIATIYNYLNMDRSNFNKFFKSLEVKGYIKFDKNNNNYILNVKLINEQINKYMENGGNKALNDETKAVISQQLDETKIKLFNTLKILVDNNLADDDQIIEYNELKSLLNTDIPKEPIKEMVIEVSTKPIQPKETAKIEVEPVVKVNHSTNNKYYQEIRDNIKQRFKIESNISSLFEELDYLEKAEIEYGKDSNQYINQYKSFDLLYNQYLKDENKPVIEPINNNLTQSSTKPIEVKESPNIIVSDDPDVIDTKEKFVRYYLPIVHRIYKGDDEATISTMDEYTRNDMSNIFIMAEQIEKIERWITRNEYSISNIA